MLMSWCMLFLSFFVCLFRFIDKLGTVVNPEFGVDLTGLRLRDCGGVEDTGQSLEEAHEELCAQVSAVLGSGRQT